MEHRQYGRSGLRISALSLGAMTFGEAQGFMKGVHSDDSEARRVLDASLEAGIDTIDTANGYAEGRSEELLGRFLKGKREQVVLATKCRFPTLGGTAPMQPNQYGLSRASIVWNCEQSLKRLQTDYIDVYQVHMQDRSVPIEETLRALDDLVRAGKVRYIGCSNYAAYRITESLWEADRHGLARYEGVQLNWSLVARDCERELIPAARAFGLGVLVWSPLSRGFLSGKYRRDEPPPAGSRLESWKDSFSMTATEQNWRTLDKVREVATRHGTTPAAVALAWLLQKPEVSSIILGARTVAQLQDNLRCLSVKLEAQEVKELDEVSAPVWGYPYQFIGSREPW
ncbi:MAG TPA: aldo/keto reductase [Myxococcales bacterium]|nr:aldo/keto reductase [Myxococcales bacterium]